MAKVTPEQVRAWERAAEQDLEYHLRQFDSPYRSTIKFTDFLMDVLGKPAGTGLDVACGAGANLFHIAQRIPEIRWTGIDLVGSLLFPKVIPRFSSRGLDVNLVSGDFLDLQRCLRGEKFDVVLSMQTLLSMPSYEEAMTELLAVTRGWLFVSSLFTDFNVDARNEVWDYSWPEDRQGPYFYSAFGIDRFQEFCVKAGCQEFLTREFEIDVDLPKRVGGGFQTYTEVLADGRRLQFTGPILLPWKFVAIRMRS